MISPLPLLHERDDMAPDLQRAADYIDSHLDDFFDCIRMASAALQIANNSSMRPLANS